MHCLNYETTYLYSYLCPSKHTHLPVSSIIKGTYESLRDTSASNAYLIWMLPLPAAAKTHTGSLKWAIESDDIIVSD